MRWVGLFIFAWIFCGCVSEALITGSGYGNIAACTSGTFLTQAEHVTGWGESACFDCHNTENIHQTDHTGTGVNMAAIREQTRTDGLSSCGSCHGSNGL